MILNVENLNKSFNDNVVLNDVNMSLNTGEITVILGPSGTGKTTLLRCLNGIEKCDSGNIEINGQYLCKNNIYVNQKEENKVLKDIGMVFQSYNLFPHLSVIENLILSPVKNYNISRDEALKKAMELLNSLGLKEKANNYPFELSGGQKQRIAIARACILNPKILCFDEPTSALDNKLTIEISQIIKNLSKNNMTILIITHDMKFAYDVADKIIFMEDGKIDKIIRNDFKIKM